MIIIKLALRNLIAAGVRTWLNLFILSLTFFAIVTLQGIYSGMYHQISQSRIEEELGKGQYWHNHYDPFDPLSLETSHAEVPKVLMPLVQSNEAVPILIVQAAIYPQGRIQPALLRGITSQQTFLKLPTQELQSLSREEGIPVMIGKRMAEQTHLALGDQVTARWRTNDGAFDALDLTVVHIFETAVPTIDSGQVWTSWTALQDMFQAKNHATLIITPEESQANMTEWDYQSLDDLLSDTKELVQSKSIGGSILYSLFMFLAMIAIFDTQALAIFKRKKEIGTLMALGMTPATVQRIFLCEGLLQGVLAALLTAVYGIPILWYLTVNGIEFPASGDDFGIAMSNILYPYYSIQLIVGTFFLVMLILLAVSYWPARHITKLLPCDALKGR